LDTAGLIIVPDQLQNLGYHAVLTFERLKRI